MEILSSLAISGGTQNITFISPITTRYLKYQIITISTNGRTDVTESVSYTHLTLPTKLEV